MVPAALCVDGSQVIAVHLLNGLAKLIAQLSCHHFILLHQFGVIGQQALHQRVNSTCKGDHPGDKGRVGTSAIADPSLYQMLSLKHE